MRIPHPLERPGRLPGIRLTRRSRRGGGMKKDAVYRQRLGATAKPQHPLVQCRRTWRPSASMVRMRGVLSIGSPPILSASGFRLTHGQGAGVARPGERYRACRRTDAAASVLRHATCRSPAPATLLVRACVSLKPDAESSGGKPMDSTPRIRTMDALGRHVLRHCTSGSRGIAVAPRRCL